MPQHSHLVTLMSRYYEVVDNIHSLQTEAAELKQEILDSADPGRYDRYTVFKVKKALIQVRAYTRRSYYGIRRHAL